MKKILVIKHGSLGDLTFALEAMFAIRKKYPNSLIYLLTEKRYISFLTKTKIFDNSLICLRRFSSALSRPEMASLKYICDTVKIINIKIITIKRVAKTSTNPGHILVSSLSR